MTFTMQSHSLFECVDIVRMRSVRRDNATTYEWPTNEFAALDTPKWTQMEPTSFCHKVPALYIYMVLSCLPFK